MFPDYRSTLNGHSRSRSKKQTLVRETRQCGADLGLKNLTALTVALSQILLCDA